MSDPVANPYPLDQPSRTSKIVTDPVDITTDWVNEVLSRNGVESSVREVRVILRKELRYSTVYRLALDSKPQSATLPRFLFLKLARPDDRTDEWELGRKEVQFYREIAPVIPAPPLIKCYDAAFDAATGQSHLLLDDLTETHSQPDQNTAPSERPSVLAVEALARMHAAWWGDPVEKLPAAEPFDIDTFIANLRVSVGGFLKIAGLTAEQELDYQRMLGAADTVWGRLLRRDHVTVTHGDLHWWNFLYPKDHSDNAVRIFDWQLWHIDLGARDLAFLLALGGFAEPRPDIENMLLRVYHDALGVPGYSWEMLIEDYRWSAIRNLNIPVIFWSQGKHYSTWQTALRRAWESYERLGCRSLIV